MSSTATRPDYLLENDKEARRLANQHETIKDAMDGKLVLAPIDLTASGLRILDSGTSDGTWLFDVRQDMLSSGGKDNTFIGTDVTAARFPTDSPQDVSFSVQNIKDPWPEAWQNSFDLVHQRLVLGVAGSGNKDVVNSMLKLVKPGGWVLLIENEHTLNDEAGPVMRKIVGFILELFESVGTDWTFIHSLEDWVREAGFVNVESKIIPYTAGALRANPDVRAKTVENMVAGVKSMLENSKMFMSNPKSVTKEDLDTLPGLLEKELSEIGCDYPMRAVWGQKPL